MLKSRKHVVKITATYNCPLLKVHFNMHLSRRPHFTAMKEVLSTMINEARSDTKNRANSQVHKRAYDEMQKELMEIYNELVLNGKLLRIYKFGSTMVEFENISVLEYCKNAK